MRGWPEFAAEFGTEDRQFAYRVTRAWLHALRDRLPVPVAANFAAQLPEVLRGVFYGGWSPSRVPVKFGPREYVLRFARDAGIHDADVRQRAARLVSTGRCAATCPAALSTRRSTCCPGPQPARRARRRREPGHGQARTGMHDRIREVARCCSLIVRMRDGSWHSGWRT